MGTCEKAPRRYDHGPFCGKELESKEWGIFRNFEIIKLSQAEDNYGRYSPDGVRLLLDARFNGAYEPKDLDGGAKGGIPIGSFGGPVHT
jgi:hypothetical protein